MWYQQLKLSEQDARGCSQASPGHKAEVRQNIISHLAGTAITFRFTYLRVVTSTKLTHCKFAIIV